MYSDTSAPKTYPISEYQFDLNFVLPLEIYPNLIDADREHFSKLHTLSPENGSVLDLIARTAFVHNERKHAILDWINKLSKAAPGIVFAAGPNMVSEGSIHLISISTKEEMQAAVQSGLSNKPKGIWVYYTTLSPSSSGVLSLNCLSIPLWLRGILSGEHIYMNRDREGGFVLKKLRDESRMMLSGASEMILSELALFDVYRAEFRKLPNLTNIPCLFLRGELEGKGIQSNEMLAESDIMLRRRNVLPESRKKAIRYLAKFLGISQEEYSKYTDRLMNLNKGKRKPRSIPPPLPFDRKLRSGSGK